MHDFRIYNWLQLETKLINAPPHRHPSTGLPLQLPWRVPLLVSLYGRLNRLHIFFWLDPSYTASLHLEDYASPGCFNRRWAAYPLYSSNFNSHHPMAFPSRFSSADVSTVCYGWKTDSTIIAHCFPLSLCFQDRVDHNLRISFSHISSLTLQVCMCSGIERYISRSRSALRDDF